MKQQHTWTHAPVFRNPVVLATHEKSRWPTFHSWVLQKKSKMNLFISHHADNFNTFFFMIPPPQKKKEKAPTRIAHTFVSFIKAKPLWPKNKKKTRKRVPGCIFHFPYRRALRMHSACKNTQKHTNALSAQWRLRLSLHRKYRASSAALRERAVLFFY